MKKLNKKGFTLAELLIVVAIIAVLVAISIPVFSSQLEKSREAVDAANIRAAYAEILAAEVSGEEVKLDDYTVELKQTQTGWQNSFDFPTNLKSGTTDPKKGDSCTFTYDADKGELTASINLKKASD